MSYLGTISVHFHATTDSLPPLRSLCICLMNDSRIAVGFLDGVAGPWKVNGWRPLQRGDEVVAYAELLPQELKRLRTRLGLSQIDDWIESR